MAIRIITDSTCDIDAARQQELGIQIAPLKVQFGQEEYIDGVSITHKEFYQKMRTAKELPITSQVNPGEFLELFEQGDPEDDIIGIFLGSPLSGTYQSAVIAREQSGRENIYLVDSGTVAIGLASLVFEAIALRQQGNTARQIYEAIEELKERVVIYAAIDDLTYLQKGGRLSSAAAFVGGLLGIKPVVMVRHGVVTLVHKTRGFKKGCEWMVEQAGVLGIDSTLPVSFAHSDCEPEAQAFMADTLPHLAVRGSFLQEIGVVVGTHAGPGALAIQFYTPRQ